jgi:hypothetical protein
MSETFAVYVGERKIVYSQYTLQSHAEGTGFWISEQEGSAAESNQISELIMDSDSDESQCDVAAMGGEECCEEFSLEPHLPSQSVYRACSSAQAAPSPDSASTSEKEDDVQGGPDH